MVMKAFNKNILLKKHIGKINIYIFDLIIIGLFSLIIVKSIQLQSQREIKLSREREIIPDRTHFWGTDNIRYNYLKSIYESFLNDLPTYQHTHQTNKTIFWCWLQGIIKAPKLYISNLNSVIMNCKDFNIFIINETNMFNYIKFPAYIIEKYRKKYISPTHFSDLLRLELLIKYGGTWVDASVLITNYTEEYFNKDLFFFQERTGCVGSSWFISSEKANPIIRATRDLLYEYWRVNFKLYNYFTFHLFFRMSCEIYPQDFKNVPYISNRQSHYLLFRLKKEFSQEKYNKIINITSVHKLTIRISHIQNNSFYHHIIKEYYNKTNFIIK